MECKRNTPSAGDNANHASKKVQQVMARIMPRQIGDSANNTTSLYPGDSSPSIVRQLIDSPAATRSESFLAPNSNAMHLLINLTTIVSTLKRLAIRAGQLPFRFASMEAFQRLRMLYLSAREMNASFLKAINRSRTTDPIYNISDMDEEELTNVLNSEFMVHWLTRPMADCSLFSLDSTTIELGAHYSQRDERLVSNNIVGMNMSFIQWQSTVWPHIASTITEAAAHLESATAHVIR
ncbi:uncharacterized protein LOC111518612 [Drosophila willistoni]|uniref:uncharacterized protein LOC111518612 n=1 Tax=Drosophila willistoni TaxID=7260 RepID=UPI000C26D1CB|nr:uncharacterized protein LOC111518612 [Drosophila willistoni]